MTEDSKMVNPAGRQLLANKRIFGYFADSLLISVLTIGATMLTHSLTLSSLLNALAILLRDTTTPQGSIGKWLAQIKIEGAMASLPQRLKTSVLRNLPFGLPLLLFCFDNKPSPLLQATLTLLLIGIFITEYFRLTRAGGLRYGDILAGDRVTDLKPQESVLKYVLLTALMLIFSASLQFFASLYLYPQLGT